MSCWTYNILYYVLFSLFSAEAQRAFEAVVSDDRRPVVREVGITSSGDRASANRRRAGGDPPLMTANRGGGRRKSPLHSDRGNRKQHGFFFSFFFSFSLFFLFFPFSFFFSYGCNYCIPRLQKKRNTHAQKNELWSAVCKKASLSPKPFADTIFQISSLPRSNFLDSIDFLC